MADAQRLRAHEEEKFADQMAGRPLMQGWAPVDRRRRQFADRRVKEVLPALAQGRALLQADLERRQTARDGVTDRATLAERQRQHWVRQTHMHDGALHTARTAAERRDDASTITALLSSTARGKPAPLGGTLGTHRCIPVVEEAAPHAPQQEQHVLHSSLLSPRYELGIVRQFGATARMDGPTGAPTSPESPTYSTNDSTSGLPDAALHHKGVPGMMPGTTRTPMSVAEAYARDAERRKGDVFVLPALHVPKIRLSSNLRRP